MMYAIIAYRSGGRQSSASRSPRQKTCCPSSRAARRSFALPRLIEQQGQLFVRSVLRSEACLGKFTERSADFFHGVIGRRAARFRTRLQQRDLYELTASAALSVELVIHPIKTHINYPIRILLTRAWLGKIDPKLSVRCNRREIADAIICGI